MFTDILNAMRRNNGVISNIDGTEFARLMRDAAKPLVVDVRTAAEYAMGHIDGAINIDIARRDFASAISTLDRDATILLYCRSGSRSLHAAALLKRDGFQDVHNLAKGLFDWNGDLVY
jgi:rhodanese-related sulfurtransferase